MRWDTCCDPAIGVENDKTRPKHPTASRQANIVPSPIAPTLLGSRQGIAAAPGVVVMAVDAPPSRFCRSVTAVEELPPDKSRANRSDMWPLITSELDHLKRHGHSQRSGVPTCDRRAGNKASGLARFIVPSLGRLLRGSIPRRLPRHLEWLPKYRYCKAQAQNAQQRSPDGRGRPCFGRSPPDDS